MRRHEAWFVQRLWRALAQQALQMPVRVRLQRAAGAARAALRLLHSQEAWMLQQPTSSCLSLLEVLERRSAEHAMAWTAGAKKHDWSSYAQMLLH